MGRRKPQMVTDVSVIDVADRGKAIGKDANGEIYILDKAVPGDTVDVLFTKKKKGVKQGIVKAYSHLSEHRVEPFCVHFGSCGGCKWQNMSYEVQAQFKEKQVKDALRRIAKIPEAEVLDILKCEEVHYYRNKLEFSFSSHRWLTEVELKSDETFEDKRALGFHAAGSFYKVVDVEKCYLQENRSNEIRNFIRQYAKENNLAYFNHKSHTGFLRNMIIRNTSIDEWMLILSFYKEDEEKRINLLDALADRFPFITSLQFVINSKRNDTLYDQDIILHKGKDSIVEELDGIQYAIGPKSFFQTNSRQAKVLYDVVKDFAQLQGDENVYDLYTGIGSIALYLAKDCRQIIGIEEVPAAIEDAKINAKLNGIENSFFYAGLVRETLNQELTKKHGQPDVLIIDPPRAGMHKAVIETILNFGAKKIVYVSCNAATQARDLSLLSDKYQHIKSQPVDMFPHTHHIETVALLSIIND